MGLISQFMVQGTFGSLWALIAQSGPVAQIIFLILVLASVLSWTIIVRKIRTYRDVEQQSHEFHDRFRRGSSLSEIYRDCDRFPMSPLAGIFKSGYEELNHRLQVNTGAVEPAHDQDVIVQRSLSGLQRSIQKAAVTEMVTLEKSLTWLATVGSVAPFIGLFGTVIGIINAFEGLGEGTATSIQAVAPGISEALVATAAGLFAAIPAVVAYNHFVNRLKVFGVEMDDFSAELLNLIERSFS